MKRTHHPGVSKVEMSGIEPESERLEPRASTSVVVRSVLLAVATNDRDRHPANRWNPKVPLTHD